MHARVRSSSRETTARRPAHSSPGSATEPTPARLSSSFRRVASFAPIAGNGRSHGSGDARPDRARRLEGTTHVVPPRPGGVIALLDACPEADVVVVAHSGLDHYPTFRELARSVPLRDPVRVTAWRVAAADIPTGDDARTAWLDEQWCRVDAWIDAQISTRSRTTDAHTSAGLRAARAGTPASAGATRASGANGRCRPSPRCGSFRSAVRDERLRTT